MKRNVLILLSTLGLTMGLCALGIFAAGQAEILAGQAKTVEEACLAEDAGQAAEALSTCESQWESHAALFHALYRLEGCESAERCLEELSLALSGAVFEDAITAARELQRICEGMEYLGWPRWVEII